VAGREWGAVDRSFVRALVSPEPVDGVDQRFSFEHDDADIDGAT